MNSQQIRDLFEHLAGYYAEEARYDPDAASGEPKRGAAE